MQIVNGYVCQNCSDVALAKKGIDPAHPKADPSKPGSTDKANASTPSHSSSSVIFGGTLASKTTGLDGKSPVSPTGTPSAPSSGDSGLGAGRLLNLTA